MKTNPFQNTKASFFDIPEIINNWVDIGNTKFIDSVMIPKSSIPIRVFGGKGTGKTHILRFFSFQSQILRASNEGLSILKQIQKDEYIGIYIEANGLDVGRFSGCGYTDEEWRNTFYYFFNLELIERVLKKLNLIIESNEETKFDFSKVAEYFFDETLIHSFKTIAELYHYIRLERKNIDNQVSDLSTPGNRDRLEIKPLFKIQDGFKDIVKSIIDTIDPINNIKILYIIDEIENFTIDQQKYLNSLVRHIGSVNNISLRLAGRLYGNRTDETLDAGQSLLENSEIKTIYLEDTLAPNFTEFAKALYKKRIEIAYGNDIQVDFSKTLEKRQDCDITQLNYIMDKHKGKKRSNIQKLEEYLSQYKKYDSKEIDAIIKNIKYEDNWLIEKINIYLLYKNWQTDLISESLRIRESCEEYIVHRKSLLHNEALEKHELDMLYQLFRNYGRGISYGGYDDIISMSNNNPRIFLSILDNLYKTCSFNDIDLLTDPLISCKIQDKALLQSSTWFWNNFTTEVKDSKVLRAFIGLCEFFRSYRRADKPVEKYAIIFSYDENDLSTEVKELIDMAIDNSLLIKQGERKDRNTGKFLKSLRIHPMMSPKWELPVSAGGDTTLSKEIIEKLFLNTKDSRLEECFKEKLLSLNVPFRANKPKVPKKFKKTSITIPSLFESQDDN